MKKCEQCIYSFIYFLIYLFIYQKIKYFKSTHSIPTFEFVRLFSTMPFQMLAQIACRKDAQSYWLHLFDFSQMCVFKCFPDCLLEKMHSYIGCICLTFLDSAFSNISSNGMPAGRKSHTVCICSSFLHCAFSNVSSKCLFEKKHSYIDCICLSFLHCKFLNES